MVSRNDILSEACDKCLQELYEYAVPHIDWNDFLEMNKEYSNNYKKWESYHNAYFDREEHPGRWEEIKKSYPSWENKSRNECIGPAPYEFFYLPRNIMKKICDTYIYVYDLDHRQNFLDNIEILKNYCKEPIIDKYIEGENGFPGHRGYEHPDNLAKEINKLLCKQFDSSELSGISNKVCDKFFEFLDMAGEFFNWNIDLNSFNTTVYLGPSPCSNKDTVIKNWKKYKNKDIEIDEESINKKFYGEDEDEEVLWEDEENNE